MTDRRANNGDLLRAELDGTANRSRQITYEELEEWYAKKELAAHRRSEWASENPEDYDR